METKWKLPETEFPKKWKLVSKRIDARADKGRFYVSFQLENGAGNQTRGKQRLSFQSPGALKTVHEKALRQFRLETIVETPHTTPPTGEHAGVWKRPAMLPEP